MFLVQTVRPPLPVLILAGGMLFGGWYGALLSSIGVTLGALVLYGASRFAFGEHGDSGAPALVERLRGGYLAHPVSYTFFLRLVPFFPFGGVTVALAWLRCPLWLFALATAFGGSLMTTIESLLGAGLAQNLEHDGKLDASVFSDPWVLGPSVLLAVMALIPVVVNRWRQRRPLPAQTPPDCRRAPGKPHHTFNLRQTERYLKQRLIWAVWWRVTKLHALRRIGLRRDSPGPSRVWPTPMVGGRMCA